ncbi:MAG: hypothetical protein N2422_11700 [Rhodobacteraceae bacterium]|nr:hypothetical protein [Paracoccaceae bacterium]
MHTLIVEVGRRPGDGLPEKATGGALLVYVGARSEEEAVRETVAVLKAAGLAPLQVTAQGTPEERAAAGLAATAGEHALMQRAREENAVVVAEATPFYD